jgi:hypothetical protein
MKIKIYRHVTAGSLFVLASVINPAYFSGCAANEEKPNFGEAEMLEYLDAANDTRTWSFAANEKDYEIELSLNEKAGEDSEGEESASLTLFATRVNACSSRTFMQSASACVDSTEVVVEGELTLRVMDASGPRDIMTAQPISGTLMAIGTELRGTTLWLNFGDNLITLSSDETRTFEIREFRATKLGPDAISIAYLNY